MFLSSWITTRNQPKNDAAGNTGKLMQYLFPVMSVVFCLTYNASFAVYWTFSSILSIITTLIINKSLDVNSAKTEVVKK